jgi:endonuclease/exonuclease/phosphatase family metal-dependent hydrolase
VRLATFNLENLSDAPGADPPLADRIRILRPQLERLDADILCLQEVGAERDAKGTPRRLRALDALLRDTRYAGYERVHSVLPDGRGPLDVHNLVILSRYPIAAHRQYWQDLIDPPAYRLRTAEPGKEAPGSVAWDRPALHAEIAVPAGRTLHVFNLHLRAPLAAFVSGQKAGPFAWRTVAGWAEGFFLASIKRNGQALEVRFAIDRLFDADPDAWIAVCGDMNAELNEIPLRILRGDEKDTGNGALSGRAMIPLERAAPDSRRYSVLHGGRPVMLDHLLVSRPMMRTFREVEIHNEALGDELVAYASVARSPESYHAPLVARFGLGEG